MLDERAIAEQRRAVALIRAHILQVRVPHLVDPDLTRGVVVLGLHL